MTETFKLREEIQLQGHIIDSWILPMVFDTIMDQGGDFEVLDVHIGRTKDDQSTARISVGGPDKKTLSEILERLGEHGATMAVEHDVTTTPAPCDGALPEDFYSTTNMETFVRIDGGWVPVEGTEMDVTILVDRAAKRAWTVPMIRVRQGDPVVVGHDGIRVTPLERSRESEIFSFMNSSVSSEKPKKLVIHEIARQMHEIHGHGGKVLMVAGPAIVHAGAGPHLAELIRDGHVDVLFGGNAVAVHDAESALHDTSLGVNLGSGLPVEGGHRHHMRAINTIRAAGSLKAAVDQGILTEGIMYEAVKKNIPIVLAGSVRDDGPIPDVITDVVQAQERMRAELRGVELCVIVCTMLHGIATGNLLPASVRTVAVDINPSTVTKLADRGSWQTVGLVTDAEPFLRELCLAIKETAA